MELGEHGADNEAEHPLFAGFQPLSKFHAVFGCNVVKHISCGKPSRVTTYTRPSPYVVFAICSWLVFMVSFAITVKKTVDVTQGASGRYALYMVYCLAFLVLAVACGLANSVLAFINAPTFVQFVRACSDIEDRLCLPEEETQAMVRHSYKLIAWQVFTGVWSVGFAFKGDFGIAKPGGIISWGPAILAEISEAVRLYSVLQLCVWGRIAQLWMSYFARAFRCYVKAIANRLDIDLCSPGTGSEIKIKHLDASRLLLERVKMATALCSRLVTAGFLVSATTSVATLSIALHCATTGSTLHSRIMVYFAGWCMLQVVGLLLPVLEFHRIRKEVTKMRYVVQGFKFPENFPSALSEQMLMLLQSVNTDDFQSSFGGYLLLQPSLIAGIMGAVAAYTVILRQTTLTFTSTEGSICKQ